MGLLNSVTANRKTRAPSKPCTGLPPKATRKNRLYLIVETDDIGVLRQIQTVLPAGSSLRVRLTDASVEDATAPGDMPPSSLASDFCPALTARRRAMLEFLLEGLSNKAIARKLGLSHFTVRNHVSQLMRLLGVATRKEAAARFADRGVNGRRT